MLLFVLTISEKFRSLIKRRVFRMEKDMVFFKDAQSADVGNGVPRGCLLEDFPFQSVSYSLSC